MHFKGTTLRIKTLFLIWTLMMLSGGSFAKASKHIVVDLTHQIAIAYQDGRVRFYGRISTGKPGHRTPTGSYYVRKKDIDHVSNLWPKPNGGARMPYMLGITRDGVAMHLGSTPNYPASHGCIRMRSGFAQRMYAWANTGTRVDIVGTAPLHSPPVALPAGARSKRMLRRSRGSGAGNPLAIMSTNPKVNHLSMSRTTTRSIFSRHNRTSRRKKRRVTPFHVFRRNSKIKHRRKKIRRSFRRSSRKRHRNPLKETRSR
jgi:hypothetical protein